MSLTFFFRLRLCSSLRRRLSLCLQPLPLRRLALLVFYDAPSHGVQRELERVVIDPEAPVRLHDLVDRLDRFFHRPPRIAPARRVELKSDLFSKL
jgi:hypothetical protein